MTKSRKNLLGFLTIFPIVYIFLFVFLVGFMAIGSVNQGEEPGALFMVGFSVLMVFHMATIVISLGTMAYLIYYCATDKRMDNDQRLMWILVLAITSMIGSIIFYFAYIRKLPETPENGMLIHN